MQKHAHAAVITALVKKLGAAAILAEAAKVPRPRRGPPVENVLSMWKRRGVPWNMRATIARLATKNRVRLPRGFLNAKTIDI